MGDTITSVGMVLTGSVQVIREDYWENRQIIAVMGEGQLFGESYACAGGEPLMVSVMAEENTEVLFLEVGASLDGLFHGMPVPFRVIQNLLKVIAGRNLTLTTKIDHMSKKRYGKRCCLIFLTRLRNRERTGLKFRLTVSSLQNYLAVDRSALSAELSKMQKEKLISYDQESFHFYRKEQNGYFSHGNVPRGTQPCEQ